MGSYNQVNGKPTCADPDLLARIIRGKWKLKGYIVSDCDSVKVFYNTKHYTKTSEEAAAKAILAGLDLNCGSFLGQHTEATVKGGLLNESAIDKALSNNFATLMRLGFFDGDPRKQLYGKLGPDDVCTPSNQELAREAARQGILLLKNTAGSLPLSSTAIKSLAVIGPNANVMKTMIGNYEDTPCKYVTPLQGLAAVVSTTYVAGCADVGCGMAQTDDANKAAASADATVLVMGADQSIEKEGLDRVDLHLPGQQSLLVSEVAKPGGAAMADVIFGDHNPSGRLPMTWYPQSYVDAVPMTNMNMRPDPATGYPGRTYRFYIGPTVYLFGEGLSYSDSHSLVQAPQLAYMPLEEAIGKTCSNLALDVHLNVKNVGRFSGSHTVFLFSSPPSVHRAPQKHLLGFEKVFLASQSEAQLQFKVNVCKDLSLVDELGHRKVALGTHVLHIGDLKHALSMQIGSGSI
ncbi:hypothetical protein EUGRSUZ_G00652 [Eucalyptus grandis]|uniref:Fibronectin type III-like domain-containing protein n=2 Tax=Eucalyptus grandis TaxID=71139 RepID=A0A059BBL6_EUCGR|nr:hypothetical protein EUGRSUZ_G00652 [Eucalyptus grandis]